MPRHPFPTKLRIETAANLLFARKGIADTTTKQIAETAGVSEGVIYRYYPSKDDLANALFELMHRRLAAHLHCAAAEGHGMGDKIARIVGVLCAEADKDWDAFAFYVLNQHRRSPRTGELLPGPLDVLGAILGAAMEAGEMAKSDAEMMANCVFGMIFRPAISKAAGRWSGAFGDHRAALLGAIWRVLNIASADQGPLCRTEAATEWPLAKKLEDANITFGYDNQGGQPCPED